MLRFAAFILLLSSTCSAQLVDRAPAVPQTPRQAILEILQSKDASAIEKHLPEITKKKIRELRGLSGSGSGFMIHDTGFAGLARNTGEKMEVFEAGPVLARFENSRTSKKIEITIEN